MGNESDQKDKKKEGADKKKKGDGGVHIPWMCRMSIALDTARGLSYLHTADRKRPLVHRDVKRYKLIYWDQEKVSYYY